MKVRPANFTSEEDLRREGVSVINDGLTLVPIPAVQLNASAARKHIIDISLY
jgi:hypothetical protein